jgi:hypothetical protein
MFVDDGSFLGPLSPRSLMTLTQLMAAMMTLNLVMMKTAWTTPWNSNAMEVRLMINLASITFVHDYSIHLRRKQIRKGI